MMATEAYPWAKPTSECRIECSASYTCDANGNRATKTLGGTTDTYHNNNVDELTYISVGGVTTKSYTYDDAGRTKTVVVGGNTTSLDYDYEGRLTQITYPSTATNTFTYNALDARVGKVDSAGTFTYKRDGATATSQVLNDGSAQYTPGISERRSSTTKFYQLNDVGSVSRITNTSQATTDTKQYDAFGLQVASSGSTPTPFGFAGAISYQEDADSGLKLLGHRYYDPSTGRFITRDPAKDGRNWYSYCRNSPLTHADPDGLLTIAGDTSSVAFWGWNFPGNWPSHNGLTKEQVIELIIETNDDSLGIWGHGMKGRIYINNKDWLTTSDINYIVKERRRRGKGRFRSIIINECESCSDPDLVKALLTLGEDVTGYTGLTGYSLPKNWCAPTIGFGGGGGMGW